MPCAAYSSARIDKLAAVVHVEDTPCRNLYYVSIRGCHFRCSNRLVQILLSKIS